MIKTPLSNRLHIGIFGKRNAGKSTLINAFTSQEIAIVSDIAGTTTDPVYKAMEIHAIGPVVIIDTGGIDDEGELGAMRVKKAYKVLGKTDIAILVIDAKEDVSEYEYTFLAEVKKRNIPFIVALNKTDVYPVSELTRVKLDEMGVKPLEISALSQDGIEQLRDIVVDLTPADYERKIILSDMLEPSDLVVMVAPLDIEAPKGRLKLPQVQTMRDILDNDCSVMIVKETELENMLACCTKKPKMVITESQIFDAVARIVPDDILLTSMSVLYARYKGDLKALMRGAEAIDSLTGSDTVLIAESCTHHPIGDDIGRVVIPNLLKERFADKGGAPAIEFTNGYDFPSDTSKYKLIIHCGGCMLNRREMMNRIERAADFNVPITNYGMSIAYMKGILDRVVEPFAEIAETEEVTAV